ncbi:MAG TPA: undecaprenyl-diphosphate phosphatase [Candidatus Merdisoma faecalis]|nr:undecaprenyl-diphosphate phosphatase [Candidatus Merdisoma faecalis]
MELLKALLFGIVEGLTEWLPISSTGHMILLNEFVSLNESAEFVSVFLVAVQLGAVLAVAVLYWKKLFPLRTGAGGKPVLEKKILILWGKICLACIPAAIVGVLFDSVFEALFYHPVPVAAALIVFGIAMIVIERWNRGREPVMKTIDDLTVPAVLIIGCFQLLAAVFSGTSRSGATIVGALFLGVSRKAASEFTFYLAVPVMFGASFLRMLQYGFQFTQMELLILLAGMAAAFLVSLAVIHALLGYIRKHDFQVFGWYRIVLGGLILLLNGAGLISSL